MENENYWIVRTGGEELEADSQTVVRWIKQGKISPETLIRNPAEYDWVKVGQVKKFSGLFKKFRTSGKKKTLPFDKALEHGWNIFKKNILFFLAIYALYLFLSVIGIAVDLIAQDQPHVIQTIFQFAFYAIYLTFHIGVIKITIVFVDGGTPAYSELFSQSNLLIKYFVTSLLYSLITLIGFLLLIVPGIIWTIKFYFYDYIIIDKNAGIIQSLKESSKITKGYKWELSGFGFLLGFINILGFMFLGIGLIITYSVTIISIAYIYRWLELHNFQGKTAGSSEDSPPDSF